MPCSACSGAGPTPDSWRIWGELIAPAAARPRRRALARRITPFKFIEDARRRTVLELDPGGEGLGDDVEIGSAARGLRIGSGGRAAFAFPGGQLGIADPFDVPPAEVVVARQPDLHRRIEKGVGELVRPAAVLDAEIARCAMIFVGHSSCRSALR